ncbi:MAG: transposase [Thermodesulfovibrionia bacterium]|nr:transposase [Thermodesulfovibrionia bacterium]
MPRIARAVALEFPHHIIQRGNNREKVFINEEDKKKYLSLLKEYSGKWDAYILAYCLMSNHVHLLARPTRNESLYKMMQGITLCYTQYFNRTYKRTGRLWESRYHSCVVDKEKYLWAVARYIEQNPVRAKIVKKADDYPYSSAKAHILGIEEEMLGEALFESRQMKDYAELMKAGIKEEEINDIRNRTRSGRPIGGESFIVKMERKLDRIFKVRPRGRPKKVKNQ